MKHDKELLNGGNKDPFKVPDGFFAGFKTEVMDSIESSQDRKILKMIRIAGKYAAILTILFFAGKGVISIFDDEDPQVLVVQEPVNDIDDIYMHISEQELTDYLVEVIETELPNYIDF